MQDLIANFYELWGSNYLGPFSQIMYENDFYSLIFIYTLPTILVLTVIYYYVIDRPKTSKLWVWLLTLLFGGVLAFVIAYVTVENSLYSIQLQPEDYATDTIIFSVTNMAYAFVIIFLFSILIKWKSPNSSHVPF
ncbi:hypothetical protein [Sediminicola arcticus]|uniref:Uncharacterized protein n=1 Tax=Sediminicola arcticus TaxID=1574308 RepID=A0ABV2SPS3_9FLAO